MAKKRKPNSKKVKPSRSEFKEFGPSEMPPVSGTRFWSSNALPIFILLFLSFAMYLSSLTFDYVLDDKIVLSENNFVKKGFSGIKDIFKTDSFVGYFGEQKKVLEGGRYRPLSLVTFAIEHQFYGLNKGYSHFINILLYALSGLLLFRVLFMLIPPLKTSRWFLSLPFIAALLFVIHPIHTEAVANIKGRDEILALLFSFSALYFSLKYVKTNNLFLLIGVCISLLLGILAKENALTWVVIIPMSLYFFRKVKLNQVLILGGALLVTVIIYFSIRINALGYVLSSGEESIDIMNNPFFGLEPGNRYATIFYTLGLYLKLLIFPHPLTHDYYPYQIPILGFGDWKALLAILVNLGLGIYALIGLRKKSIISYGILFYFITLSIVSNLFVNVGTTMNERFVYMPSVGICIVFAYFLARWLPAKLNEKADEINIISVGLLLFFVIGYIGKTVSRVPDWENALTLNAAAVKYSPNSARANCFMGVAIYEDYKLESDVAKKAVMLEDITYYIDRALEIYPGYGSALTMKSGILAEHYKKDFDINKLLAGFTTILRQRETTTFTNEYIEYLIKQKRSPNEVSQFLYNVGYTINFQGRQNYNAALYYLNYAYQVDPANRNIIQAIAQCYQKAGNQNKANEFLQKLN